MTNIIDTYEINENTLALIPAKQIDYDTTIIETNKTIKVRQTPLEIIKAACYNDWCTYDGRRRAVTHHTNFKHKVPIPINFEKGMYFFPTHSPTSFDNQWIAFQHIFQTRKLPDQPNKSTIIFYNGTELTLNISHYTLTTQMKRTFECMYKMERSVAYS